MAEGSEGSGRRNSSATLALLLIALMALGFAVYRPYIVSRMNNEAMAVLAHGPGGEHRGASDPRAPQSLTAMDYRQAYEGAINKLNRSARWDPRNAETMMLLGEVHWRLGNKQQAFRSYERCIQLAPENVEYRNWYGELFLKEKNWSRAKDQFAGAVKVDPRNETSLRFLALICQKQGAHAEAVSYAERLRAISKRDPVAREILDGAPKPER